MRVLLLLYISITNAFLIWPFNSGTGVVSNSSIIDKKEISMKKQASFLDYFSKKNKHNVNIASESLVTEAKLYAHYAGAAYCRSLESIRKWNCTIHCDIDDTKETEIVSIFENLKYKTRGFIAINNEIKTIILSFRGTNKMRNFLSDSKVLKLDYDLPKAAKNAKIHRGFLHCTESLKKQVLKTMKKVLTNKKHKEYKIIITGHSLGGSMAVLTALYLKEELNLNSDRMKVYTYGQPRIGNSNFASFVNNSTIPIIRVINRNDPIPHMPPTVLGFRHHANELYISNPTTTLACHEDNILLKEDPSCSSSRSYLLNLNQHLKVWNILMGTYC